MPGLGVAAGYLPGVEDLSEADLVVRAQIQMVLQQLTEQLTGVYLQPVLQRAVAQPGGLLALQPGQHRLEPLL